MSQGDDKDSAEDARVDNAQAPAPVAPSGPPVARGASLRRALALALPVPDLARDAGGALVVDTAALDLGADEIAEPLSACVDPAAAPANPANPGPRGPRGAS